MSNRYECDCGAVYNSFDGLSACQAANHYQPCQWSPANDRYSPRDYRATWRSQCGHEIRWSEWFVDYRFCPFCGAGLKLADGGS